MKRFAQIVVDTKNNQIYFQYANGEPGDVLNPLQPSEIKTYKEICNKLNHHEKLIEALEAEHVKNSGHQNGWAAQCQVCALLKSAKAGDSVRGEK